MSVESASLKIGFTMLKVRNLSAFHSDFKQTDFLTLRFPDFLNAHQPRRQSRYAHFVSRAKGSLSAMSKKRKPYFLLTCNFCKVKKMNYFCAKLQTDGRTTDADMRTMQCRKRRAGT